MTSRPQEASTRRIRGWLLALLGLGALQLAFVLVYGAVERSRRPSARLSTEQLSGPAPPLSLVRADGSRVALSALRGQHVLVHFWATWCLPCRRELPELLALAADAAFRDRLVVLAVSVDEAWDPVRSFFRGTVPHEVARADDPRAHGTYGGTKLPDTYLVGPDGTFLARIEGARDWSLPDVRASMNDLLKPASRSAR